MTKVINKEYLETTLKNFNETIINPNLNEFTKIDEETQEVVKCTLKEKIEEIESKLNFEDGNNTKY